MEVKIIVASPEEAMALFGLGDRNLKLLRDALPVNLSARNGTVKIAGEREPVEDAARILNGLMALIRDGAGVPEDYVDRQLRELEERSSAPVAPTPRTSGLRVDIEPVDRLVRSKGQARYVRAILENDMVFCIGPAGSGKTYLAVRLALGFLRGGDIRKIVLCRPAVEAGEKLGFLPGDFQAKINPYLRPLYDALHEILDYDQVKRYLEREIIEVIPLAYMRGRTLNHSFIILDEGQNTTISQMKMFLTRMGMMSKIVVTGDVTQLDLPKGTPSGLIHASNLMKDVRGIGWIALQKGDILRHPLVKKVVAIYEEEEIRAQAETEAASASGEQDDPPGDRSEAAR